MTEAKGHPVKKLVVALGLALAASTAQGADMSNGANNFYRREPAGLHRVSFNNQSRMQVAGNLFLPKDFDASRKYAAIIVGHPMGAVKEQSSNLYAQKL